MQIGTCIVRLGGDLNNSVFKRNVTPAEILVLQAIHGQESITRVRGTGANKVPHVEELNRLVLIYGGAKNNKEESIVAKMWPTFGARLPVNFKDIGIDISASDDDDDYVDPDAEKAPKDINPEELTKTPGTLAAAVSGAASPFGPTMGAGPAVAPENMGG